ncbi:MAG: nuclear transport factor 2 family protein [Bacteroidota bacterium]
MKSYLVIFFLALYSAAGAQSKKTAKALAHSKLLVKTIFETKDSATLDDLFAPGMKHQAANGRTESREEAIRNIAGNRSVFVQADMLKGYGVTEEKDSSVVKYFYRGRENKPDGTSSVYTANLVMVWVKEKKDVKLLRLETIKIE